MKASISHIYASAALVSLSSALVYASAISSPEKKDKDEDKDIVVLSPFTVSSGFGATPGGAKDARFFRSSVEQGLFPHPSTITAEGLFSEYDLPLKTRVKSKALLSLNGEAMPAQVLTRPDIRYLAQIGFSSGLDPATWHREPLNLVAVVDKSGSMNGKPLDLVKACLLKVLSQLGPEDQMAIVLYGDRSYVHLQPTSTSERNKEDIESAIDAIVSAGSTNMEEGLRMGFELARESQQTFKGRTRVMQFTDERPNVGDTSAGGFMGLMEAGSRDGIGQTTIGVGVQFGAELAAKVSSVRGGNLFFFPNAAEMEKTFGDELDMLVTELAYDMDLVVHAAPGLRLVGVYGIPGEMLTWEGERDVRFHLSTLFLSKRRGAIYLAFASDAGDLPERSYVEGRPLASVDLSYREVGRNAPIASKLELPLVTNSNASLGLQRGRILVSEYLALKRAMTAHLTENNQEQAYWTISELHGLLAETRDSSLKKERAMVQGLYRSLSKLSGHGE